MPDRVSWASCSDWVTGAAKRGNLGLRSGASRMIGNFTTRLATSGLTAKCFR
jgi:hypothetical protein